MSRPAGLAPADITVCIPAWQAEDFIDRTLGCARRQTYSRLRILVSVDHCIDRTVEICRHHAALDPRVEVIAQPERLGWSENCNAVLARVDTAFYFLYFHDDIIAPTYCERLRAALLEDPEASSAHCDLERFGNQDGVDPGHRYDGSAARRLLDFMIGPVKGTPLRSLTRSELLAGGLRFPDIGDAGFWRCHPFLFRLLGAGRALHVPEVLYRRWFRDGSMTRSWDVTDAAPLLEGQRASVALCSAELDRLRAGADEGNLLRQALYLFAMTWTRRAELQLHSASPLDPGLIHPDFPAQAGRAQPLTGDPELDAWFQAASTRLRGFENRLASLPRDRLAGAAC